MKKVGIDFFAEVKFISQLKAKGDYLSYVISEADVEKNIYTSSIYLYDLEKHIHRRLTSGTNDGGYYWLNENEIIFKGKRDEKKDKIEETIFYKINIHGGEAEAYLKLPYLVQKLEWINDHEIIFMGNYNPTLDRVKHLKGHEQADYIKDLKEQDDYEVIEEIPFWSNGGTFNKGNRTALYKYNIITKDAVKITSDAFQVQDFTYEKCYNSVYFTGKTIEGKSEIFNDLYIYENNDITKLSPVEKYSYRKWIQISEDELLVYGTDHQNYGLNENGKFSIFNKKTGTYEMLTPDFYHATGNSIGSDLRIGNVSSPYNKDDSKVYFPLMNNYHNQLMSIDFKGKMEVCFDIQGGLDEFVFHKGQFYGICMVKNSPQELYTLKDMKPLSDYNQRLVDDFDLRTPEHLSFTNQDGITIDGFIIRPSDFNPEKKYPVILDIHGGPKTAYGDILYHEMQYWANEGYVVIYCNPRGSDGKGNSFADIRGKYGTIDYEDIMAFVDEVFLKYSFVDQEKIGVTGGSYGGFMTNWIIDIPIGSRQQLLKEV
ncbi:MAG: S9 family peptidase [Clostridia bacterium]|nr:S9 family peptidase [Clostridia bacterium]